MPQDNPAPDLPAKAKRYFQDGDFVRTLECLERASAEERESIPALKLAARALTQLGQPAEARRHLLRCAVAPGADADLLSLEARTWKDTWEQSPHSPAGAAALRQMLAGYQSAFEAARQQQDGAAMAYAAVNLATFHRISGEGDRAVFFAKEVMRLTESVADRPGAGSLGELWSTASRAEAFILLGQPDAAQEAYQRVASARDAAGRPWLSLRELASVRKQARLTARHNGLPEASFDHAFNLPAVIVFAGHRVDAADRPAARFPAAWIEGVRQAVAAAVERLRGGIGYSSAADGADLLFLEAMRSRRAETHLILTCPEENFRRMNVDADAGADWPAAFQQACRYAEEEHGSIITASSHQPKDDSLSYRYAMLLMSGLALQRARDLDLELRPLVVWDGRPGDGQGGAADFHRLWKDRGVPVEVIDPRELPGLPPLPERSRPVPIPALPVTPVATVDRSFRQEIKAILFADVVRFSELTEDQVVLFSRCFMGAVSSLITQADDGIREGPVTCNTWGDGLYMVFHRVTDAARFTLDLQRVLVPPPEGLADWSQHGLPADLSLRIALHAGPVFLYADPVTRALSYTGRHTSHAARLEPVTPPGQIWTTEAFAALAALEATTPPAFRCDYAGTVETPKKNGLVRAHRLVKNTAT